jgi:hypothetical protein
MRNPLIVSLLVLLALPLLAEQQSDPSGHWEGVIRAPQMDVQIEVDLDGNRGTFGNPARGIRGFPLSDIAVTGAKISFALKTDGGGSFAGTLAGKAMTGLFTMRPVDGKTHELPFELTRVGDAKIESVPASPAVDETLAGTWSGSLEADGRTIELGLVIRNHPNGTASGAVITSEQVEIALTRIVQKDAAVSFEVRSIGGAFEGTLTGKELAGTWTQGPFHAPITFRRPASPVDENAIND